MMLTKTKNVQKQFLPTAWLRFFLIVLIIGIFFRFSNLDRKVYWLDETFTSLRLSGYTEAEIIQQQVLDDRTLSIEDLQRYQRLNSEKGLTDTLHSLAVEDPHHPPLYYTLTRFWMQWFGSSVAAIRSLSAVISLLIFPCIYWLCQELFESPLTGWVAIALVAISPFHVLYAQEAREYSLWTVAILLSSAALLRAIRLQTKLSWGVYGITVALGLYSFLFSALVTIAHGIYLFLIERFRFTRNFLAYLLASIAGALAFLPWLLIVIANISQIQKANTWSSDETKGISYLAKRWAANFSQIFVDFVVYNNASIKDLLFLLPIILFLLVVVGYSIYFICRHTSKRVWLFVLTLTFVPALILAIPDIVLGGYRSGTSRYVIPFHLGVQLSVAYLLANKIAFTSLSQRLQRLWKLVAIALISGGIISCLIISPKEFWWHKSTTTFDSFQASRIVNQSPRPLLIVHSGSLADFLSFSHYVEPKVKFQWWQNSANTVNNYQNFSDVFIVDNSATPPQYSKIKQGQNFKMDLVYQGAEKRLWKLEKP